MKMNFYQRLLGGAALAAVFVTNAAAGEANRFYFKGDLGVALTEDVKLREFFGAGLPANSEIELDPGVRFGIKGGYEVTDWFATEIETGVTANRVDSISTGTGDSAGITQVPLLLNVRFQCPACKQVSPYFGGGAGFASTIFWGDGLTVGTPGNQVYFDGGVAGIAFAYQAFAGVRFSITERMSVNLEYHFFGTGPTKLEDNDTTIGAPTSQEMRLGRTTTHAITAAFQYSF
jgi:opacity protein-like surface antigen